MSKIGERFRPGVPAPVAGLYQCTSHGCTKTFTATVAGTSLPPAHHVAAGWRLVQMASGTPGSAERPATPPPAAPPTPQGTGAAKAPQPPQGRPSGPAPDAPRK